MAVRIKILLAILMFSTSIIAQIVDEKGLRPNEGSNLMSLLPPLQMLIDSAIANSPEISIAKASITQSEHDVRIGYKDWTELIGVTGRYTYGQFVASDLDGAIGLSEPRGGYQVFAGVTIPLGYFATRNDRIASLKADLDMDKQGKRRVEMDIRDQVIVTYNRLLLLQRLINISAEARESAILQYQMAENRFRNGEINLEELGRATDLRANFMSEYEKLRAEFTNVYTELERIVGTPFSKFPK